MIGRLLLREHRARPWQSMALITGIALGVAVVVAVQITNSSVEAGFRLSNEAMTGRATHQVVSTSGQGVDEAAYFALIAESGVKEAAPMVTGVARPSAGSGRFDIVGIDPFVESDVREGVMGDADSAPAMLGDGLPVLIHPERARDLNLEVNDALSILVNGRHQTVRIGGLLQNQPTTRSLLVCDISVAQALTGKRGRLDRIDLILEDETIETIKRRLPADAVITKSAAQNDVQKEMTRALETNLTAFGLLALVIGMFLVYNAVSFSVIRRRRQIGLARALGVTRGQVFSLVIIEALTLGALASLIGLALGLFLASFLLDLVSRTINDLYFRQEVTRIDTSVVRLLIVWCLGVGASVVAAIVPALEATRTDPGRTMLRSDQEARIKVTLSRASVFGVVGCLSGVLVIVGLGRSLEAAFLGLFLVIAGVALIVPALADPVSQWLLPLARRFGGTSATMAVRNISRSRSRTGVALAALVVAVSATSGVGMMISNFRQSVVDWLSSQLNADVYISAQAETDRRLSPSFIDRLISLEGVRRADIGRWARIKNTTGTTEVFALDTAPLGLERFQMITRETGAMFDQFKSGGVLITEPLSYRRSLGSGDTITLRTLAGDREFPVIGVYRDYGSDRGVVLMYGAIYRQHWQDETRSSLALYLDEGFDDVQMSERIAALDALPDGVRVFSNRSLRTESLAVFDRTFAVTRVLRLLAVLIAAVGIVSALVAIQTERMRETALLRAIGLTKAQLFKMSLMEAGVMGLVAGFLAMPLGVVTAWILSAVVNRRAFGWSMDFHIHANVLAEGMLVAVLAAVAAGALAAAKLMTNDPARDLRAE